MHTTSIPSRVEPVNPTAWSQAHGFDHGQIRRRPEAILTVAGQGPLDADGLLLHADDPAAQLALTLANLADVLAGAGMGFADVAQLRIYTTDLDALLGAYDVLLEPLTAAGARPPSTLVEVSRLPVPGMTVEIDAIAVR